MRERFYLKSNVICFILILSILTAAYIYTCTCTCSGICMYIVHVNERCRRKEERSKQGQTNNKAKQHSTPKAVTFPSKTELPRVRLHMYIVHVLYMYN